jgi:nitroimidazol reductase NimA-like FMN-containing flavoprotein (pyridoxamine 5'-phosphate oxidase superfamily)
MAMAEERMIPQFSIQDSGIDDGDSSGVAEALQDLVTSQRLAVLATQSEGQPYASLVAFTPTPDLQYLLFATGRATRKYENLSAQSKVAMLVENTSNQESDFHAATAATAVGSAEELNGPESGHAARELLARHPHLSDFVKAPSTALFRVRVEQYTMVRRFQTVVILQRRQ